MNEKFAAKELVKIAKELVSYHRRFMDDIPNPDSKDEKRILDMMVKSNGNDNHFERLARQMANSIKDKEKALRRGKAADNVGYPEIADIFYERADHL